MDAEQTRRRVPKIPFRVLIIGRANAGKTSILQRVCETTESPLIYRGKGEQREEVKLDPSVNRGEHQIDDELVFSNHKGYIFHDSKGIESGSIEELEILKDFIQRKCGEKRLRNKLHAIWYCVPMDNQRPGLDIKFYDKICSDPNVPVIALFTKYDQFLFNVEMDVLDDPDKYPGSVSEEAKKRFQEHYLRPLGKNARYVRLEKMHMKESGCNGLIEKTAAALNEDVVGLMLLAVQRGNLELSVNMALNRVYPQAGFKVENVVYQCLVAFPYIWLIDCKCETCSEFQFHDWEEFYKKDENHHVIKHIMSLPTIIGLSGHHLIFAVILILKHATSLWLSNESESALTLAELDYQKANIDLKIQEYLKASSLKHSVEEFAHFIMDTEIASSQSFIVQGEGR